MFIPRILRADRAIPPVILAVIIGVVFACCGGSRAAETWSIIASPDNSFHLMALRGEQPMLNITVGGWGPNWGWTPPPESTQAAVGGVLKCAAPFVINKQSGQIINVGCQASKGDEHSVMVCYTLSADKDVALTKLVATLTMPEAVRAGQYVATLAGGSKKAVDVPGPHDGDIAATAKVRFAFKDGAELTATFDPPCPLQMVEGGVRVLLAADTFKQGSSTVTMTLAAPGDLSFVADEQGKQAFLKSIADDTWYPFTAQGQPGPSVIGMENWLDKPAGKHGGVRMVGDHFELADGQRIKFWGVNLAYAGEVAPEHKQAEATAAKFAKYGINAVRLHKFFGPNNGWEGINDLNDAMKTDPAGLDRLDYMCDQLARNGVYFGFSHTFDMRVGRDNKSRLLAYDEIMKLGNKTMGLINFAGDVQDMLIERLVTLLKHRNPYSGKTYAEDPALNYIECQNEDDIFFFTTQAVLEKCPTYHQMLRENFSAWLVAKYGSREALNKAWGGNLKAEETLAAKNIEVQGNPWFMGDDAFRKNANAIPRMLDNAAFFHEVQDKFYTKFVKAVRDAGYKGPLVGSPWQAPTMLPHYYNLQSDYQVGYIDRHDYFGEKITDTMLSKPGSGYFGAGLQQVIDRPFGLSEWITCYPAFYSADGPAIIAAYGFGLQGWDASYEFTASSKRAFETSAGGLPWGIWNVDVPAQIGQFPALSRMIMRGDIKEGDIISTRKVSKENLATGKFNFTDKISQTGDVKTFGGAVPPEALAAGRVVVQFVDQTEPSTLPDMSKYVTSSVVRSNTGQLSWDYSGKGFFTVNTDGTKAVVGFAGGQAPVLGDVKIAVQSPYASIVLTALDRDATLATAKTALLSAVARNCNTGFKYQSTDGKIIENGKGPILIEPVKAQITITGRPIAAVNVLDQDGRRTDKTLEVTGGSFTIDGTRDRTLYYEIVYR